MDHEDIRNGNAGRTSPSSSENEQSPLLHSTASARLGDVDGIASHALHTSTMVDPALSPYRAVGKERMIAYMCFLVMGASVLLPWNLLIVVTPYLNYCLTPHDPDGRYYSSTSHFASFVPLIYTLANLFLIVGATYSQQKKGFENIERKLIICIAVMGAIIFILILTTLVEVPIWIFYIALMTVTIAGAGVCASLQSASAALTTIFEDPFFMQGVMSGQGAIGFSVSITQFLSALNSVGKDSGTRNPSIPGERLNDGHKLVSSTYHFLVISLLFTVIAGIATYILINLPSYEYAMKRHKQIEESLSQNDGNGTTTHETYIKGQQHHNSSIWQVNRKIRDLGCALAYIFIVSIGLFPGITVSIASTNPESSLASPLLWIPLGFVVFNTADWIGRALPGFQKLVFTDKRKLILATVARTIFIPLVMLCNVQLSSEASRTPFINSDIGFLAILILFAISNGYLTALLMMRAITEKNLHPEEVDVASSIMLIYLTAGVCLGAILSIVLQSLTWLVAR